MNAYSKDLREKVVRAYEEKQGSIRDLAKRFMICKATVGKWLKEYRELRLLEPVKQAGGKKPKIAGAKLDSIKFIIKDDKDATLEKICKVFEGMWEIKVCVSTMWRALKKLGFSYKKKCFVQPSKTKKRFKKHE